MPKTPLAARNRRRDEILRAAAGLFASDGYASTSMREVAAASGILPGSLYHHFESKEAIAVELVEDTRQRFQLNVSEDLACEALCYRLEHAVSR